MTDKEILDLIENEIKSPTFGVTEQLLQIHSPVYEDDQIKVDRIDRECKDGFIIAYLPVQDESFYFEIYIDLKTKKVAGFSTEAKHKVCFQATSETLTLDQLKTMTMLPPTKSWNIGDSKKNGKSNYTFTNFTIVPNPEPDAFEDKLKKLLSFLEQDKDGIKALVDNADCCIGVTTQTHIRNGMIGGPSIDSSDIQRMNSLGLGIYFDMSVWGNSFKE